jgi:HSP20 family protein
MAIVRYDPFTVLNQLQREMNRLFDTGRFAGEETTSLATSDWMPAVDIKEEENRLVIQADLPGVDPKDIEIRVEHGVLTLKGQRVAEAKEDLQGYQRIERVRGTFLRRFSLPDNVDPDKIAAKSTHGVLEVIVPKTEGVQPRKIDVES